MPSSVTDRVRSLLQKYTNRPATRRNTDRQGHVATTPASRRTQIVATIGPASESPQILEELIQAGMNIARFNTKHNAPEWHVDRMNRVRAAAAKLGMTVPLLLDLQGPEVRSVLVNKESFPVEKGESITFTSDAQTNVSKVVIVPVDVVQSLKVGSHILLEDGICEFVVESKNEISLHATAQYPCTVKSRKTLNTPGTLLNMPSLLPTDLAYLDACKDSNLEYVALSFVRDKKDIEMLRSEMQKRNMTRTQIVAKIENQAAIDHLDEIITAADAIMVARGDLGVELPFYEVPHWQKIIIQKSRAAKKFVITATQMLLSMVEKPRPTRAEVTDVATAVYDHSDAVMLSEESAMGKYPVKTVMTQAQIVAYHEQFV